ncbi:hypothetical protein VCR29J2_690108 [Vibrio coralliirubri]|nr:hypothetical protein VCR29J2_690108 [Vibrio coralliirubri]
MLLAGTTAATMTGYWSSIFTHRTENI